ncbi:MAG: hypothetical protein ACOCVG_05470 [Verrucomicrobiota bacterium]
MAREPTVAGLQRYSRRAAADSASNRYRTPESKQLYIAATRLYFGDHCYPWAYAPRLKFFAALRLEKGFLTFTGIGFICTLPNRSCDLGQSASILLLSGIKKVYPLQLHYHGQGARGLAVAVSENQAPWVAGTCVK